MTEVICYPTDSEKCRSLTNGRKDCSSRRPRTPWIPLVCGRGSSYSNDKMEKLKLATERIMQINRNITFFLLRHCLSVPKPTYTLRSSSRYIDQESLHDLDDAIAVVTGKICSLAFDADAWTIVTMPVKYGGLGPRLSNDVAIPAYLASTAISKDVVDLMLSTDSYAHEYAKRAHWDSTIFPVPNKSSIQSEWGATFIRSKRDAVLAQLDQHRRVRILSASTFHSGAWLNAAPRHQPELFLTTTQSASLQYSA